MMRKRAPRLAAAFVVTISAGCGGGTKEPVNPDPDNTPTDTTGGTTPTGPDDQSWVPNLGSVDTKMYRDADGKCYVQHPANPPWSEQVDCETQKPIKPEEPKPDGTADKKPEEPRPDLPAAPAGWRVEHLSDGSCKAFASTSGCPEGARCNPPPPRKVKCP